MLQVYFFNTVTSESAWTEPEGFEEARGPSGGALVAADATAVASSRIKGTAWSLVTCVDGRKYYLNSSTEVPRCSHRLLISFSLVWRMHWLFIWSGLVYALSIHSVLSQLINRGASLIHIAYCNQDDLVHVLAT